MINCGFLAILASWASLNPSDNRSYSYDVGNRITNLTDPSANITGVFTHDKLDRLTSQNFNQEQDTYDYAYDANNNRYFDDHYTPTSGNASSLVYPAGNNLNMAYSYDGSGKATSDWERSYTYNSEGRIERIQKGSVGIYNAYNALGQRVQKNSGNTKTYFLYDESGKLTSEVNGNGSVVREYVYLGNAPLALLSDEKPNEVLQVHSDHLGTPRALSDKNATVIWRWEGDQFGTQLPQIEMVKLPLRHSGQYEDREVNLFYNYFRFYDPKTGRYVENDPIDLKGGLNRYVYVSNNTLKFIDPYGLVNCEYNSSGNLVCGGSNNSGTASQPTGCVTAECAGGLLPNPPPPSEKETCTFKCSATLTPVCIGVGIASGDIFSPKGSGARAGCFLVKQQICKKYCEDCSDDRHPR